MGGGRPPSPPDPRETARAQTGQNVSTAIANTILNSKNISTPMFDWKYTRSGERSRGLDDYLKGIKDDEERAAAEAKYGTGYEVFTDSLGDTHFLPIYEMEQEFANQDLKDVFGKMTQNQKTMGDIAASRLGELGNYGMGIKDYFKGGVDSEGNPLEGPAGYAGIGDVFNKTGYDYDLGNRTNWITGGRERDGTVTGSAAKALFDRYKGSLQGGKSRSLEVGPDGKIAIDDDKEFANPFRRQLEDDRVAAYERQKAEDASKGIFDTGSEYSQRRKRELNRDFIDREAAIARFEGQEERENAQTLQGILQGAYGFERDLADFDQRKHLTNLETQKTKTQLSEAIRSNRINEIMQLFSASQLQQPQMLQPYTSNIPTTDYAGIVADNYAQRVAAHNAKQASGGNLLGSLLGFGGSLLGGPFGGMLAGKMCD